MFRRRHHAVTAAEVPGTSAERVRDRAGQGAPVVAAHRARRPLRADRARHRVIGALVSVAGVRRGASAKGR
ncbi:hypothetical protein MTQ10_13460 [Streptomyces sp. XM83C]|uniref:Uncharacterized protein n=1 Tax=Streptomyces thermocoprophilus TaxID=78356 RepID=A0ABV5V8Q7_9ACTN|nr:hypothetical protein [Streptomyces sp. XM83C]MCK1820589.1 hypothetical protein [Streptomyces sp. XM83C]